MSPESFVACDGVNATRSTHDDCDAAAADWRADAVMVVRRLLVLLVLFVQFVLLLALALVLLLLLLLLLFLLTLLPLQVLGLALLAASLAMKRRTEREEARAHSTVSGAELEAIIGSSRAMEDAGRPQPGQPRATTPSTAPGRGGAAASPSRPLRLNLRSKRQRLRESSLGGRLGIGGGSGRRISAEQFEEEKRSILAGSSSDEGEDGDEGGARGRGDGEVGGERAAGSDAGKRRPGLRDAPQGP